MTSPIAVSDLLQSKQWKHSPVWYFAYGSNMKAATMTNRGITPLKIGVAKAESHYLTFDIFGIPFSEPSYASIEEFPENGRLHLLWKSKQIATVPCVCGLAYSLTPEDFRRLLVTEGAGVVYDVIQVECSFVNEASETINTAYTLKAKRPMRPNGCPSIRYMKLFRDGAEDMKLPPAYISYLETIPCYDKHTPVGSGIFKYLWRPLLKNVVRLINWRVDADGNCPQWVAILIIFLYELMWIYHDFVHLIVFERGDGGKLEFRVT